MKPEQTILQDCPARTHHFCKRNHDWLPFINMFENLIDSRVDLTLEFPVGGWPYLSLHIATTKLPTEKKTRFEYKYYSKPRVLLTFYQLVEFLKEQCWLFDNVSRDVRCGERD
ncbi:hypothetical protein EVAR_81656_1 [Eumeta japonica]|uniref:Uncharacterized protein n=1 Tax=Eumeta variegata TaxID=151549 RepID=A0A4C1V226_EUMVA|nr:hypothetical protein EVAR_81656_1 [Eumeta japonica]